MILAAANSHGIGDKPKDGGGKPLPLKYLFSSLTLSSMKLPLFRSTDHIDGANTVQDPEISFTAH